MLNITNHQRNANQNYNETPPHTHQDSYYQKEKENNQHQQGHGEIGTLAHYWCECKIIQPLQNTVWRFLKILKIDVAYDSAIPLLSIYPKELQAGSQRPMFVTALFTIAKMWKQPKHPLMEEWIHKMWYKHTVEYYSVLKRKGIL